MNVMRCTAQQPGVSLSCQCCSCERRRCWSWKHNLTFKMWLCTSVEIMNTKIATKCWALLQKGCLRCTGVLYYTGPVVFPLFFIFFSFFSEGFHRELQASQSKMRKSTCLICPSLKCMLVILELFPFISKITCLQLSPTFWKREHNIKHVLKSLFPVWTKEGHHCHRCFLMVSFLE